MKKILLAASAFILCACGNGDYIAPEEVLDQVNPKEYIVSFGFQGEITSITESPLSRAATNDLYGIQVYSKSPADADYKPYAYGLFDDKSNMSVKLLEGYKYKFESSMVVDGKTKIYKSYDWSYGWPFYAGGYAFLGNAFIYSTNKSMTYLKYGAADIVVNYSSSNFSRPNIDRYYGSFSDYTPVESSIVNISMSRVVFGLKVIADGLTEGKLNITLEYAPISYITYPEVELSDIFTFYNNNYSRNWTDDDYFETIPFSVSWEKLDGAVVPLVSQNITFKRNKLTTVTIKVKDNSIGNGVNLTNETAPMSDGDNIVIEAGDGVNTGVNPTP